MQPTFSSSRILLPVRPWFIFLSLIAAAVLNFLPTAHWPGMPDWVALVLCFWSVREFRRVGMGWSFLFGVLMDVADGSLMGQHALAYVLMSYIASSLSRRILWFPLLQQALQVFPLLFMVQVLQLAARMATGAACGAINGWVCEKWKVPSFIVTLAGMLVFRGLTMWILGGQNIGPFPPGFQMIASGFIPDIFGVVKPNMLSLVLGWSAAVAILWMQVRARAQQEKMGVVDEPFAFFAGKNAIIFIAIVGMTWALANFRGLPNVFIVMALLVGLYAFISERTTIGRRIYAIGGNAKAAKLSGINSERVVFLTFANMGMLAALAGIVVSARLNSATPKAGVAFELDAIAAVFVGGASMAGGVGTVIGAVVGAFIMGVMNNGMSILGIGIDYQQVIKGLVLMAAVIFDVSNKSKS